MTTRAASPSSAMPISVCLDADMGAALAPLRGKRLGGGGAAILVDVEAVGIGPDREHLRAELPQGRGRDPIGRTIGAIDHDAQAIERKILRQGALGEFDVAVMNAVDALGASEC